MLRVKRDCFYRIYKITNHNNHLILCKKKNIAEFKSLTKKNKKESWENLAGSLNYWTTINIAWDKNKTDQGQRAKKKLKKSIF